jgi:cytochrome P450
MVPRVRNGNVVNALRGCYTHCVEFNPYSRRLHADPYPAYAVLQRDHPAYFNERFGFWVLSRYEDVQAALRDWQTFSSASGITLQAFTGIKPMIILMDPPRQSELRAVLQRAFTPRRIAALEGRIRAVARGLIEGFRQRGWCDFSLEFGAPYPTSVIADLLGVDAGDRREFKAWSDAIMTARAVDAESVAAAYGKIFEYFARAVAQRRRAPGDDLVSVLVVAEAEGAGLSEDELLGFCALLLIAGNETMANFLGNAMLTLDRHAAAKRALAADPSLMPCAVEELLRFEPPVHELGRTLTRELELHGQRLPRDARVLLLLAAANRDPRRFEEPDRLVIRRSPNDHLSFGLGVHFCLGANLARLEARIALEELLQAIPDYRVTTDEISWFRTPSVRGPASLPIEFKARQRAGSAY